MIQEPRSGAAGKFGGPVGEPGVGRCNAIKGVAFCLAILTGLRATCPAATVPKSSVVGNTEQTACVGPVGAEAFFEQL